MAIGANSNDLLSKRRLPITRRCTVDCLDQCRSQEWLAQESNTSCCHGLFPYLLVFQGSHENDRQARTIGGQSPRQFDARQHPAQMNIKQQTCSFAVRSPRQILFGRRVEFRRKAPDVIRFAIPFSMLLSSSTTAMVLLLRALRSQRSRPVKLLKADVGGCGQ